MRRGTGEVLRDPPGEPLPAARAAPVPLALPDGPVLLFYDGHERRAEEALLARWRAELRRHARVLGNGLLRRQLYSGFYTWFRMLVRALERAGCEVRVNDFAAARRRPGWPIGAAGYPSVLDKLDALPNPRLVGPGLYASPLENAGLFDDPRNRLFLSTCEWYRRMFAPYYGDRLRHWFGGFDIADFGAPDPEAKTTDVLVYDKIYFDRDRNRARVLDPFLALIERQGLSHETVRYGAYHPADYAAKLRRARCLAFFCHSETQGMAYQECLARGVPIFAWDEGHWPNPAARALGDGPVPCTSVPYFDARCGMTFRADDMPARWEEFRRRVPAFAPRAFIAEEMTLDGSARAYLAAYREAGGQAAPPPCW